MPTDSPLEALKAFVAKDVQRILASGSAVAPHLVFWRDGRPSVHPLPPFKPAWAATVLALNNAVEPEALALVMTAHITKQVQLRAKDAPDRRNAAVALFVGRQKPEVQHLAWTFSIDFARPLGTPGRHFDVRTIELPDGKVGAKSPHLDALVEAWQKDAWTKQDPEASA